MKSEEVCVCVCISVESEFSFCCLCCCCCHNWILHLEIIQIPFPKFFVLYISHVILLTNPLNIAMQLQMCIFVMKKYDMYFKLKKMAFTKNMKK